MSGRGLEKSKCWVVDLDNEVPRSMKFICEVENPNWCCSIKKGQLLPYLLNFSNRHTQDLG